MKLARASQVEKKTIALLVLAVKALSSSSQCSPKIPLHLVSLLINLAICPIQIGFSSDTEFNIGRRGFGQISFEIHLSKLSFYPFEESKVRASSLTISESLSSPSTSEWCLIQWCLIGYFQYLSHKGM